MLAMATLTLFETIDNMHSDDEHADQQPVSMQQRVAKCVAACSSLLTIFSDRCKKYDPPSGHTSHQTTALETDTKQYEK